MNNELYYKYGLLLGALRAIGAYASNSSYYTIHKIVKDALAAAGEKPL